MNDFLAVFDVDGTLLDSQAAIVDTMVEAFEKAGAQPPTPEETRGLIGLSLNRMISILADDLPEQTVANIVADYRIGFANRLDVSDPTPLFPGVQEGLERLHGSGITLGIATGKSKRGMDRLLEGRRWGSLFTTTQCADFHPSKPHSSMLRQAMSESLIGSDRTVMIGDSTYDMEMARAAHVRAIGVGWGYHSSQALLQAGAGRVEDTFEGLVDAILEMAE